MVANDRKWLQAVANDHKWSQTIANGRKRSQAITNRRKRSQMVANDRKWSQTIANRRKWSQTIANGRKRSQTIASDRKPSQTITNGCKPSQTIANGRKRLQMVTNEVLIRTECLLASTGDAGPTFNRHSLGRCRLVIAARPAAIPTNTKHLYNICTTPAQRLRRIVQMLYKCFVFAGLNAAQQTRGVEPVLI